MKISGGVHVGNEKGKNCAEMLIKRAENVLLIELNAQNLSGQKTTLTDTFQFNYSLHFV